MPYLIDPDIKTLRAAIQALKKSNKRLLVISTDASQQPQLQTQIQAAFAECGLNVASIDFENHNAVNNLLGDNYDCLVVKLNDTNRFHLNNFFSCLGSIKEKGCMFLLFSKVSRETSSNLNAAKIALPLPLNYFLHSLDYIESSRLDTMHQGKEKAKGPALVEDQLIAAAAARRLFIVGERGVGKTTLLRQLLLIAAQSQSILLLSKKKHEKQMVSLVKSIDELTADDAVFAMFFAKGFSSEYERKAYLKACLYKNLKVISIDSLNKEVLLHRKVFVDEVSAFSKESLLLVFEYAKSFVVAGTTDGYEGSANATKWLMNGYQGKNDLKVLELGDNFRFDAEDDLHKAMQQLCNKGNGDGIQMGKDVSSRIDIKLTEQVYLKINPSLALKPSFLIHLHGFLSDAHYKTTPNDFADLLLGDREVHLLGFFEKDTFIVTSCCLCVRESLSGYDDETLSQVFYGRRRPKGNLILQKILGSGNSINVDKRQQEINLLKTFHVKRIVRIATKKQLRQKGLASQLVHEIKCDFAKRTCANEVKLLGVSCGATYRNTSFWLKHGFSAVMIGLKKNRWLATSNVIFLTVITDQANHRLTESAFKLLNTYECRLFEALSFYQSTFDSLLSKEVKRALLEAMNSESFDDNENGYLTKEAVELFIDTALQTPKDIVYSLPAVFLSMQQRALAFNDDEGEGSRITMQTIDAQAKSLEAIRITLSSLLATAVHYPTLTKPEKAWFLHQLKEVNQHL